MRTVASGPGGGGEGPAVELVEGRYDLRASAKRSRLLGLMIGTMMEVETSCFGV